MEGISIIIPCYNAGGFLNEAVQSIKNQKICSPYEIIIVDDCSTNMETRMALEQLLNDSSVKLFINSRNRGVQYSRNIGLTKAKFDYILPLDADDCLNTICNLASGKNIVDYSIQILKDNPDIAFVQTMSKMFGLFNGYTISSYPTSEELSVHRHHIPTSIIYRREDGLKALYDLDILKWQDWSFGVSLMNQRLKQHKKNMVFFIPEPFHLYRIYSSIHRISSKEVDEKEVINKTISKNIEIFQKYFKSTDIEKITQMVYKSSPDRLEELLHVAKYNIHVAKEIIKQRNYDIVSSIIDENIP